MKIFETKGEETETAEVNQLYKQDFFEPIIFKYLTTYEIRKSCDVIILFTNSYVYERLNRRQIVQLQRMRLL